MSSQILLTVVASSASLATLAIITLHVVLALSLLWRAASCLAIASALLELLELAIVGILATSQHYNSSRTILASWYNACFGLSFVLPVVGAAVSIAAVVLASMSKRSVSQKSQSVITTGTGAALGLAFACQILCGFVFFVLGRSTLKQLSNGNSKAHSQASGLSLSRHLKSIRYSRTMVVPPPMPVPMENQPSSWSTTERSSLPSTPCSKTDLSSKTRLVSSAYRPSSASSTESLPEQSPFGAGHHGENTSNWDGTQLKILSYDADQRLPKRFLEPIPASPVSSLSADHCSPQPQPQTQPQVQVADTTFMRQSIGQDILTPPPPILGESHIHPLFRSDSPTPPPPTSPGTVVVAAPNAGQVISDRGSIRSVALRNGSITQLPNPLHRSASATFSPRNLSMTCDNSYNPDNSIFNGDLKNANRRSSSVRPPPCARAALRYSNDVDAG